MNPLKLATLDELVEELNSRFEFAALVGETNGEGYRAYKGHPRDLLGMLTLLQTEIALDQITR